MSIETITDKTHRTVGYIETVSDGKKRPGIKFFTLWVITIQSRT